ncbi:MAG: hypothetical protein OI74_06450 [Gammaproteobacteria bacterium (ex Lamellibrachia satsuma)]|nr:MAG: glycosyltransferase [Gammaproteobacteria bacterium (ex Lamellibrachia satsuma)]RRS33963.1 MAG: hypothetical protein OI74_06450 [Gammaproteobacteria bacterium (ex Lamellibrachia satsuma)]RRS35445.1 MAG: hypothetical protein NV67_10210 [Gammaproteobacteria bacterium (ex Lamellibrachia satsuma)]
MTTPKPRLIVADPSLADARGHHFALSLQITRGAQLQGIETIWFTHKDFIAPDWLDDVSVNPVFSITMYDSYHPEKKNKLQGDLDQKLLGELFEGILRSRLSDNDHIYFHTGFGDLYRAMPTYLSLMKCGEFPYLHICTPYEPEAMPGTDQGNTLPAVFGNMRNMSEIDKKLFFWAETPQLALHYTLSYRFNVRALSLPPPIGINNNKLQHDSGTLTALYLGAAREEKGFLRLSEIVDRLYEHYGCTGKICFVIQCSPQIIGYLPSIKLAIEKLSGYPESYVKLIDSVMSEDEYHSQLLASDVVLLMYDKENYRIRGSGIAVEAISSDKCILTTKGTFCAGLISHGGGEAVEGNDEAVAMLLKMAENKHEYMQRAKIQGEEYRKVNSVTNYVSRIINQPKRGYSPAFFPSTVIGHVSPSLLSL